MFSRINWGGGSIFNALGKIKKNCREQNGFNESEVRVIFKFFYETRVNSTLRPDYHCQGHERERLRDLRLEALLEVADWSGQAAHWSGHFFIIQSCAGARSTLKST